MAEEILGTLAASGSKLGRDVFYELVFTSTRVIVARTATSTWLAWALLGGPLGGALGAFRTERRRRKAVEHLAQLAPDDILAADKDNYQIPYTDIVKVHVGKRGFMPPTLRILTHETEYNLGRLSLGRLSVEKGGRRAGEAAFDECINIVRSALPDKVETA